MITFIVRTKNEDRWIGHCIQSIIDRFSGVEEIEIKIIDNESIDDTLQVIKMFSGVDIEVLEIPKSEYTPGKSLNLGLSRASAKSNISCLISAHCTVDNIDHNLLTGHFEDRDCFGIIGKQIPVYKGKRLKSRYVWENFKSDENQVIKNLQENIPGNPIFFHNAFSFINMEVWKKHHFNEKISGKEDRLWANEMLKNGLYCLYDSSQSCIHHWTPSCATWSGLE